MAVQPQYLAYILEQLERLGALRTRRMFGAVGLYSSDLFFAIIDDDTLFLKADARNVGDYLSRDMPRFMPDVARPADTPGYYQVPADIIEDAEGLVTWARRSLAVALAACAKKRPVIPARTPARKAANKTAKSVTNSSRKKTARKSARAPARAPRPPPRRRGG